MRLKALPWLIGGELSYLFVIFGSNKWSSLSRWIAGFWLQVAGAIYVLAALLYSRAKRRRQSDPRRKPERQVQAARQEVEYREHKIDEAYSLQAAPQFPPRHPAQPNA